jgi:hypothetical protein
MRFPNIFSGASFHREPEIPADEARFIRWILGSGPPPGSPREEDEPGGLIILSPVADTIEKVATRIKWWK